MSQQAHKETTPGPSTGTLLYIGECESSFSSGWILCANIRPLELDQTAHHNHEQMQKAFEYSSATHMLRVSVNHGTADACAAAADDHAHVELSESNVYDSVYSPVSYGQKQPSMLRPSVDCRERIPAALIEGCAHVRHGCYRFVLATV